MASDSQEAESNLACHPQPAQADTVGMAAARGMPEHPALG